MSARYNYFTVNDFVENKHRNENIEMQIETYRLQMVAKVYINKYIKEEFGKILSNVQFGRLIRALGQGSKHI